MAVHVGGNKSALAERKHAAAAGKARNQKIALVVLGVILAGVVALELPAVLSRLSGPASPATAPAQPRTAEPTTGQLPAAVPIAASISPTLKRLAAKDPFVPQLGSGGASGAAGASSSGATLVPRGPAVRTAHLRAKDPFVPQLAPPAAAIAATATPETSVSVAAPKITPVRSGGGFVVVVASEPAANGTSATEQAMVAAENAGLPDVKSSLIHTQAGGALDVYMGPYATKALAQSELIRALRVGYSLASVQSLPTAQPSL